VGYSQRVIGAPLLLVDDPLFDQHRCRGYHPERPERLEAARRAVVASGAAVRRLEPRDASDDELARAHDAAHLTRLARLAGREAAVDADTFLAPKSVAAARRAAGGGIALVEALLDANDGATHGVALLRPPGHHATPEHAMGFCLLNNVAVAAHAALARGLERVAVVDFDVHHGNGTQDIFWRDPRVLFVSLHQYPLYPGTGSTDEVGAGEGAGYTVNVPLSEAAGDGVYLRAFEQLVVPVLEEFRPELLLVSAGFDAHARDPLASMSLSDDGYAEMVAAVAAVARRHASGRVALLLEGGYDLTAIEGSLSASIRALSAAPESASAGSTASRGAGRPSPRHTDEIARARRVASKAWKI
jgi:acetoin utilization deacetylase AcuC-like enzyme